MTRGLFETRASLWALARTLKHLRNCAGRDVAEPDDYSVLAESGATCAACSVLYRVGAARTVADVRSVTAGCGRG